MRAALENTNQKYTIVRLSPDKLPKSLATTSIADSLRVARVALERLQIHGSEYAKEKAPTSPNRRLSGNKRPGETRLDWLKNRSKCNQFVGDVLTEAGFQMPMNKMQDGTFHYAAAESLPRHAANFKQIAINEARVGDVVIFDWQTKGENGAHAQIITKFDRLQSKIELTGAGRNGAQANDYSAIISEGKINGAWLHSNDANIYILRPILKL